MLPTVAFDDDALLILNQTKLPNEEQVLPLKTKEEVYHAIKTLQVRGAPAIGVAAAFGLYLAVKDMKTDDYQEFMACLRRARDYLASARPTAVNLSWALKRMEKAVTGSPVRQVEQVKQILRQEAESIRREDVECCRAIGEHGLTLLRPSMGILTHCNAGRLAAIEYGTATAPIYLGQEQGYGFHIYADETRPLLQGARLTAYELQQAGVDVTLICDNMASAVMQQGWVQAVLVGCDRVAANGDTANKVGTSGLAVLAKNYGIPVYVCAPSSTIDLACEDGSQIIIEERPAEEVTKLWYQQPMAPEGIAVYNPSFDVTGHELVTAFITEYGILHPPFAKLHCKEDKNDSIR